MSREAASIIATIVLGICALGVDHGGAIAVPSVVAAFPAALVLLACAITFWLERLDR